MSEQPTCPRCDGKGWMSPSDADRATEANGELFNAGYAQGKSAAPSSAEIQTLPPGMYQISSPILVRSSADRAEGRMPTPIEDPLGDAHHTDMPLTKADQDLGDHFARFMGDLFLNSYNDAPTKQWATVCRALRIHGLQIGKSAAPSSAEGKGTERDARLAAILQQRDALVQEMRDFPVTDASKGEAHFSVHIVDVAKMKQWADQLAALGADEEGK